MEIRLFPHWIIFFAVLVILTCQVYAKDESKIHPIKFRNTHPCEMTLGHISADAKALEIFDLLDDPKKLKAYMKKNHIHYVLGRNKMGRKGTLYLVERHHHSRGAEIIGIESGYGLQVGDLSHIRSRREFWDEMKKNGWVYPFDANGNEYPPEILDDFPNLASLTDNPYRSLAGLLQDRNIFKKPKVFYGEFMWADFFAKNGIVLEPGASLEEIIRVMPKAEKLARSAKAKKLPGFIGKE